MPIKAIYDEKPTEAITLQPDDFVETEDGKWMPAVEAVEGFRLEDVSGLRSTLQKAKANAAAFEKRLKAFGEHTPDTIAELSALADAAGDGADIDERVKVAVAEREKALKAKLEQDVQAERNAYTKLEESWRSSERDRLIMDAMAKAGAPADLLAIYREKVRAETIEGEDGSKKVAVKVLADDGTVRLTNQPGKTDEMSVGEYVASLKDHPTWGPTFKTPEIKGDDAPAPNQVTSQNTGGVLRIPATDQSAIDANWEKIASGEAEVV